MSHEHINCFQKMPGGCNQVSELPLNMWTCSSFSSRHLRLHMRMKCPRPTLGGLGAEFTAHAAFFSLTTVGLYCTQRKHACRHKGIWNTVLGLRAQTTKYAGVSAHSLQTTACRVPMLTLAGRVCIWLSHI